VDVWYSVRWIEIPGCDGVCSPLCDGEVVDSKFIDPNGTYAEVMHACDRGGVAMKFSKSKHTGKPMQFEYSVWR
jgi:hypothetical protein